MGANRAGQRRKRHQKRSLKNWRKMPDHDIPRTIITIRGAVFRRPHPKDAGEQPSTTKAKRK